MERVCHLANKIYREMLCITRHERKTYITISGLDHVRVNALSWAPQLKILLSWDLLDWIWGERRIPYFFTSFITTPELSGPWYISPDIYHTQITEYLLESTYKRWALFSANKNRTFFLTIIAPQKVITFTLQLLRTRTGALGNTFPMLFPRKESFIYSDQLVQHTLCVIAPENWYLIRWRLLLSGFRSVLVDATDKLPQTNNPICGLGTWFRATEWLVRSLPGWTPSIPSALISKFEICQWAYHQL